MRRTSRVNPPNNIEAGAHLHSIRSFSLTSWLNRLMSMRSFTAEENLPTKKLKIFGRRSSGMNQIKKALRKQTLLRLEWKEPTKSGRLKIEISIESSFSRARLDQQTKDKPTTMKVTWETCKLAPWTRLNSIKTSSYKVELRVRCKTRTKTLNNK